MNWDSICYVLQSFDIRKAEKAGFEQAYHILLLDDYVLDDANTLYICLNPDMEQRFTRSLIISIGPCRIQARNYIELANGSVASVFNALMEPDQNLKTLGELLNGASSNQEIIDMASSFLSDPFFYFDESYRILGITKNAKIINDPEWEYMSEQKFLSPESIRMMQDSGDLEMLARETEPVIYDADFFPFVSIVTNIYYQGKPFTRLNRLCLSGNTNPVMKEECRIVARALSRLLSVNSQNPYRGPSDHMIRDLLGGERLPEALIRERLDHFYYPKETFFRLCVIDVGQENDIHVPSYYSMLINNIITEDEGINLLYEDHIVIIFRAESEEELKQTLAGLAPFLSRQGLRAGVSDTFRNFSYIRAHYEQACAALEVTRKTEMTDFESIAPEYLVSLIPEDKRKDFIPFALRKLQEEQSRVSFRLRETLRVYLECNCSLQQAAQRLYLHKNTMLYRINRIRSVIGSDLDDPYQRMMLLIALNMDEDEE